VYFEPAPASGARERIVIELTVPAAAAELDRGEMAAAATSGGVTGRVKPGSELDVRFAVRKRAAGG
jgi:hypothetical protein